MHRIDSEGAAVALPTPEAVGSPVGYFTEGNPGTGTPATVVSADWANAVQEELANAIEDSGVTLSKLDRTQLSAIVNPCRALRSSATDTGESTNTQRRLVGASTLSRASGIGAVVMGSSGIHVSGQYSLAAAVDGDTSELTGDNSAIIAGNGGAGGIDASGTQAAAIGCDGGAAGLDVPGTNSAAAGVAQGSVGGLRTFAGGSSNPAINANAANAAALASNDAEVDGTNTLVGASSECVIEGACESAAILASDNCEIDAGAARAAIVGSTDCVVDGVMTQTVLLGSENVEIAGAAAAPCVAGGYSATPLTPSGASQNLSWRLDSQTGVGHFNGGTMASGADYAELFENETKGALPPGRLVARKGRKVRIAGAGDRVVGVVSVSPAVLANDSLEWHGRFKRDEWGRLELDKEGHRIEVDGYKRPAKGSEYIGRSQRPAEWTPVGLVGQLRVAIDDTVELEDFIAAGADGIGTKAAGETRIEVMEILVKHTKKRGYGVALCLVR